MPTAINPKIAYPKANGPIILAQSAVPVILAPNGTIATNGILTIPGGSALPTTYSGGAWVRFPANAVVGGLAGLYWTVFSSTTQGQVSTTFIDPATQFIPFIPTGLTNAVGSNVAYTQTTAADITLSNVTVPGGLMGPNGALRTATTQSHTNNGNSKLGKTFFGGASFGVQNLTSLGSSGSVSIRNRSAQNSQLRVASGTGGLSGAYTANGNSTLANDYQSINTAIDQQLIYAVNLATATDFIVLEGFTVEVLPS